MNIEFNILILLWLLILSFVVEFFFAFQHKTPTHSIELHIAEVGAVTHSKTPDFLNMMGPPVGQDTGEKRTKRKSLTKQIVDKLDSMIAYGESKHKAKRKNGGKPPIDKIYSKSTLKNYKDACIVFGKWVGEKYGIRYIDEGRAYVAEYLMYRTETLSAWTVKKDAAALAKLYQCSSNIFGVELPKRCRKDIRQHREQKWKGHYKPSNHQDLEDFSRASGLRRKELLLLSPEDVYINEHNEVYVFVKFGKGGRTRHTICLTDAPLRIARAAAEAQQERMFLHIPKYAPLHEYRAEYARALYRRFARPIDEIPRNERYVCRKDKRGIIYDKKAMKIVTESIGHSRLNVLAESYL